MLYTQKSTSLIVIKYLLWRHNIYRDPTIHPHSIPPNLLFINRSPGSASSTSTTFFILFSVATQITLLPETSNHTKVDLRPQLM
jgi:hypothetical protein